MKGKRGRLDLFVILIEILFIGASLSFAAFAQDSDTQVINQSETTVETAPKRWAVSVELNVAGGFTDTEQASYLENRIGASWNWNDDLSSSLSVGWQEDITPDPLFSIQDTFLTQSMNLGRWPGGLDSTFSVRVTAPSSKVSRDASLISAIRSTLGVSRGFWKDRIQVSPSLAGTWNFHRYEFALQNKPGQRQNVQLALRPGIELGLNYADLSFSTAWAYVFQRTYLSAIRHQFAASLEAGYTVSKNLYVGLGLSNEGSTTRNGGRNSNVTLFDQDTTEVFATTKLSF